MSWTPSLPLETPKRSAGQRREALALANQVRSERAALKAALKRGAVSIATVLSDPPQYLTSAKVTEVLLALPGYGPKKISRLLERCQVSPRKSIEGLNDRQRGELIKALEK